MEIADKLIVTYLMIALITFLCLILFKSEVRLPGESQESIDLRTRLMVVNHVIVSAFWPAAPIIAIVDLGYRTIRRGLER